MPEDAVFYDEECNPAIVQQSGNSYKLCTCCLVSCGGHVWGYVHATSVNLHNRVRAAEASAAAEELRDQSLIYPDGVLDEADGNANGDGDDANNTERGRLPLGDSETRARAAASFAAACAEEALPQRRSAR